MVVVWETLLSQGRHVTGARESNAGDDYHFWWAARRALALIDPSGPLEVLTVEGLTYVDDPDDDFEAIDVGEYLGGQDFASASQVVVSQLKYSTRHPERPWTVARLCAARRRRRSAGTAASATVLNRSVLRDLGAVYRRLVGDHGRDTVLSKLRLRLVSNRPVDDPLMTALGRATATVHARQGPLRAADLLKTLQAADAAVIGQLRDNLGHLSSQDFCDFLTILDLSECGMHGRTSLEREVRGHMAELSPDRSDDSARALYDLVHHQALPDQPSRAGLRRADVLAALGVADLDGLYPAPPRLTAVEDPLPAPSSAHLAKAILGAPGGMVLAHGPLGAGKTTTLTQLGGHLPPGCAVLVYDCFGAGEYLSTGEERHTPRRFVTQIVNELAQLCGTPLLLRPPESEDDLWRRLTKALRQASDAIPSPGRLVLAVDAADNAAFAAERKRQRGFLPGLLDLPLPERVTVVLTARSHRISQLGTEPIASVELRSFDAATSAQHLRRHYPDATTMETDNFHSLTDGNPRMQFYALDRARAECWSMSSLLMACRSTPDLLFKDVVDSALQVSGSDAGGVRWLALLAALSRPVRVDVLIDALQIDRERVLAFAEGLFPGVRLEGDTIAFRDEDFEKYVMQVLTAEDLRQAHHRLADVFLSTRSTDPDAAAHVAEHLFDAGRTQEVVRLVLDEPWPASIPDGFRRLEVQENRLDLALLAAASTSDAGQAVRLVMRAAAAASSRNTLAALVRTHVDLASHYADPKTVARHHLHDNQEQWLAPVHMRTAAILSRDPTTHEQARQQLAAANAWLRRWRAAPEDETRTWQLDAKDVARAAEAYYRLDGPVGAATWLRRWRPIPFMFDAMVALAERLAPELGPIRLRQELDGLGLPPSWHGPFLAFLRLPGQAPLAEWVEQTVRATLKQPAGKPAAWKDRLCEIAVRHGDHDLARCLLEHWLRPMPEGAWNFRSAAGDGTSALRQRALIAALDGIKSDADTLLPPSLQPTGAEGGASKDRSYERGRWLEMARPLLRMCLVRARLLVDTGSDDLPGIVEEELRGRGQAAVHRWFRVDSTYRAWAALAAETILDSSGDPGRLGELADWAPALLRNQAPWLWLDLAAALTARGLDQDGAADLCLRAATYAQEEQYSAVDRLELLAECTAQAGEVSSDLGRTLFGRTLEAAASVDDAAAQLLRVHACLASRGASVLMQNQAPKAATRLAYAAEFAERYVTDPGLVPHAELLAAIGRMHPPTAFATASRWDDEDRFDLGSAVPSLLASAVDSGFFTVPDALCLQHLIKLPALRVDSTLALLERLPPGAERSAHVRRALRQAAVWLRRHVPASDQASLARRLANWVNQDGAADDVLHELLDPVLTLGGNTDADYKTSRIWSGPDRIGPAVTALLDSPGGRALADLSEDVQTLTGAYVASDVLHGFILAVATGARPDDRISALGAVAALADQSRVDASTVLNVLAEYLRRWRGWPGISAWAAAILPDFVRRHLPALAWQADPGPTLEALRAFGAPDETVRQALLAAVHTRRAELSVFQLQNLALLFAELTDPSAAADALIQTLDDLATYLPEEPERPLLATAAETVTGLLWSAFGHPRKAVRWRAAHAARELLLLGRTELADGLVGCLDATSAGPFRSPELHFYWLSARVWLLVVLQRVATERPQELVRHVTTLTRVATDAALPHAQIRELARSAALTLAVGDLSPLTYANRPVACRSDRSLKDVGDRRCREGTARYDFDSLDTLPYWYAPLAQVFGVPLEQVAVRAERWIVDEWGVGRDEWMADVRELRDERSFERMSHRHGAIPNEESLRLYLEYHAMMLAAGELADAGTPVCVEPYEDPPDPWEYWLRAHLPGSRNAWLADLRGPVPAEPLLFGRVAPLERWQDTDPAEFGDVLGLSRGRLPDEVLVSGYVTIRRSGGYGTVSVKSALVHPAYAPALQRALQAADNPTDWKLPDEGESEFEVDHGPFQLRGWLRDSNDPSQCLDELDPYAHGLRRTSTLPGQDFRSRVGCSTDAVGTILQDRDGRTIAWTDRWSDEDADTQNHSTDVRSSGNRTFVRRTDLLHYLTDTDMQLIVEVQIGRQRDRGAGSHDYTFPSSHLYLLNSSGKVHSI